MLGSVALPPPQHRIGCASRLAGSIALWASRMVLDAPSSVVRCARLTGGVFALPLCEMWHFDSSGRVVGGDLYYDQVSLLMQLGLMPQPASA